MSRSAARQLTRWLTELGSITDQPGKLTRTFLSPAMRRANAKVARWMHEAGLKVRQDTVGNVIGRVEGAAPRAKTLVLGSHLDTVRDAGRFDGAVGVLLPIVALAELKRRKVTLPFAVEVVGFSEEEGVRFASAYLGSKGYLGRLGAVDLGLRDAKGVSVREALRAYGRGRFVPPKAAHRSAELLGYIEVHIEQGPVLEAEGVAVGVVHAIAGQARSRFTFMGRAGHAGTTPMAMRQDALVAAAEFIQFVETFARDREPLVATVGTVEVEPSAPNVIAGRVRVSLDVRHMRDQDRDAAEKRMVARAAEIAGARKLKWEWEPTQNNPSVVCDPLLRRGLEASASAIQGKCPVLVSGAGHDAVMMATVASSAMLFVRCRDGLSHHPEEYASPADLEVALRTIVDFLERLARKHS